MTNEHKYYLQISKRYVKQAIEHISDLAQTPK